MNSITLEIPYPPSVNSIYRHAVRGKHSVMFMTDKGKKYQQVIRAIMLEQGSPRFGLARLHIVVEAFPPDRRKRDLGNLDKVLMDSLEKAQVFEDDSQIDRLTYIRKSVEKGGKVIVKIQKITETGGQLLE